MEKKYKKVEKYYGSVSDIYENMYDENKLHTSEEYMADCFRYNLIIKRLKDLKVRGKILDIGCGEGTPITKICNSVKLEPYAFDVTDEMVGIAKKRFEENEYDPSNVFQASITDLNSLDKNFKDGFFDASLCLGVMPHVPDVLTALKNIKKKMANKSVSFISFRNLLFSLFTLNRYTKEFLLEILMSDLGKEDVSKISTDIDKRLAVNLPPIRTVNKAGGIGYDTIPAEFHNPLTIKSIAKAAGFSECEIYFYHFHPAPPMYEKSLISKESYREMSINMEKNPSDWRGNFMCSAFLLELKT